MGEQELEQGQEQPQAPPSGQAPAPGAGPQIPPAVAQAFLKATMAAMKLIYSKPETVQGLLQIVKSAATPQEGCMKAAMVIQSQLSQESNGGGEVIKRMLNPIASLIAELARAAGLFGGKAQEQPQEGEQPAAGEEPAAGAEAPAGDEPSPEEGAPADQETPAEDAAPGEEEEGLVQQKMRG